MKGKVSAAVLEAPYNLEVRYFDKPRLGPKDLLMKVKYCGICGSDIHLWRGDWNPPYPMILGHEFIGEVAEAGNEALEWRNLDYSDQIAVEMILPCNKCEWCLHGLYNLCRYDDRSVDPEYGRQYGCNIPISRPPSLWGGYAQYLFVPENAIVHKYERRVEWKEGALTEPLAVSVHAIKVSKICPEDSVAVVGPGTIGLMSVVAAKVAGAKSIILIGTRESRLKIGEALGADYLVNVRRVQNPVEEVKKLTNGIGVDVVIETAGTSIAQQQALRMAKRGGRVVLVGLTGGEGLTIIPDEEILTKELTVKGSYLSPYAYEESMRIIQSGKFQLGNVITHIFPLEKVNEAFQTVIKREGEVIKALIDPWL